MRALKKYKFIPDFAVAPGNTIIEVCNSLHMTKKELAIRLELTEQTINRIIKGEQPITYITANKLELVTGINANFWNNLEANYREQIAKIQEHEQLKNDIEWLKKIPVKELINRGHINPTSQKTDQLRDVLQFYGVSSVKSWSDIWEKPKLAARRSHCFETIPEIASAWIRCGEIGAKDLECADYNKAEALKSIDKIRDLTTEDPDIFIPKMIKYCCQTGIAISFVPKMDKVPWNGASKWLSPRKALIILNIRGKKEDKFWFSFFHELGHILFDSKKGLYIADGSNDPIEIRADNFAAETLISSDFNTEIMSFRRIGDFHKFAEKLGISVSIVAGRYQHLTGNWNKFNNLIKRFEWKENSA